VVTLAGIFTIGIWVPRGRVSFGELARSPVIYAVAVALVLMATDTHLPRPIDHAFTILGGLAIPLMLLTLGHTRARTRRRSVSCGTVIDRRCYTSPSAW
jgi:predicted permease